jgi:hypothetical protein
MKENFAVFSEITGHRRFLRGGSSILIPSKLQHKQF